MENKQKIMEISKKSGEVVGKILVWFISALLIMWGLKYSCTLSRLPIVYLLGSFCNANGFNSNCKNFMAKK